jgi:hypothetical protein
MSTRTITCCLSTNKTKLTACKGTCYLIGVDCSNCTAVWGCCAVACRTYNAVNIASIEVAGVDSIALVPSLSVERTVSTERYAVLGQDVAGEEVARLVLAIGINEVVLVKVGLRFAGRSAQGGIIWAIVEKAHTVVGVVVLAVLLDQRSINGSLQVDGSVEVLDGWCSLAGGSQLGVSLKMSVTYMSGPIRTRTVAAHNDNLELLTPLSLIGSRCLCDWVTED